MARAPAPTADLLARGASLHREGRLQDAAAYYLRVLETDPDHVEACQLLGLAAHRLGHSEDGLGLLDRALARDPDHAPARSNRALVLRALGRDDEAERDLRAALRLSPGQPAATRLLIALLVEQGRHAEAEPHLRRALAEGERASLWADLGRVLLALGRAADAVEAGCRATTLDPTLSAAWHHLGLAWRESGDLPSARDNLARALALAPEDAEVALDTGEVHAWLGDLDAAEACLHRSAGPRAARALASVLSRQGREAEALEVLEAAARTAPADPSTWIHLIDLLCLTSSASPSSVNLLAACPARDGIDHQRLDRAVRARVEADLGPDPHWRELLHHPLLASWLTRSIVVGARWELILRGTRAAVLEAVVGGEDLPLAAVEALAVQAWATEHAWWATPEEQALAGRLEDSPDPLRTAALAMYRPVSGHPALATLTRMTVEEPALEACLARAIPTYGEVADATSLSVQAQYEDNPYPRLVSVHLAPRQPLRAHLRGLLPPSVPLPRGPVEVLIAGCGTGQHAISVAARTEGRVLGVDLSRRSLGRAARVARASGIDNLDLCQADLLNLGTLDRRFHLIDGVGVLHHLAEPAAGWKVLAGLLAEGGLMRVGLYSERGRSEVVAARALVERHGWTADPEDIRRARRALLELNPDHPAWPITASPDFGSISGCRDLVFHACEHRTTPAGLGALLDEVGMELVAFQHPSPLAPRLYAERWPDDPAMVDLDRWDTLEAAHPRIFSGMMLVWCRRAPPGC